MTIDTTNLTIEQLAKIVDAGGGTLALDGLSDVAAPTPSGGDVLTWNAGSGLWVNQAAGAPGAHQFDGASHTVSGLTSGHFLKALSATTFGFAVHGLTYTDVGALAVGGTAADSDKLDGYHATAFAVSGHNHGGTYDPLGTGDSEATAHVGAHESAYTHANIATAYGWGNHASAGYAVAASYTGASTIVTVGTITSGIWNAGAVTSSGGISATTGTFTGDTVLVGTGLTVNDVMLTLNARNLSMAGIALQNVGVTKWQIARGLVNVNDLYFYNVATTHTVLRLGIDDSATFYAGLTATTGDFSNRVRVSTTDQSTARLHINNANGREYAWVSGELNVGNDGFSLADITGNSTLFLMSAAAGATFKGYPVATGALTATTGTLSDATDATSSTAASLKTAGGIAAAKDLWLGTLGRFDSTSTPVTDYLLGYNGTKWVARQVQLGVSAGIAFGTALGDGTTVALFNSSPTLNGTPGVTAGAPTTEIHYHAIAVDMSATVLPAGCVYVLDYSVNGAAYSSGAIIGTGNRVVHSNLDPAKTYAYKYLIRGATDSAYSTATGALSPGTSTTNAAFGLIAASQLVVQNLAAISADLGTLTTGRIQNALTSPATGILLSGAWVGGTPSVAYLNLAATGANPILYHAGLSLNADGSATFAGLVDTYSTQTFGGNNRAYIALRDAGTAHGLTTLCPTNVGAFLGDRGNNLGGLDLYALSMASIALYAKVIADTPSTAALGYGVVSMALGKRGAGTAGVVLVAADNAFSLHNLDGSGLLLLKGNGDLTIAGGFPWGSISGTPTTRAGYGITDAAASSHTHGAADLVGGGTEGYVLRWRSGACVWEAPTWVEA